MNIELKLLTTENAAQVALLSAQLGYQCSESQTEQCIKAISTSRNDAAFAAFYEKRIVGWIHVFYTLRLETNPFCEIGGLVVDEHFRGKGIGKELIAKAKEWCVGNGCNDLRVRSNVLRDEAHLFYQYAGFIFKKEQKVFEMKL